MKIRYVKVLDGSDGALSPKQLMWAKAMTRSLHYETALKRVWSMETSRGVSVNDLTALTRVSQSGLYTSQYRLYGLCGIFWISFST